MPETAADKRARIARELADLETDGEGAEDKPKRLSKSDRESREKALRGDLPLPGIEHRPHLDLHDRYRRQWPPAGSATVPHEPHSEVVEHEARRWPTALKESK